VRHGGFSCVLLPKPQDDILKDAGVTILRELRCLENPSGAFDESSWQWAFVSVAHKIYVARGMPYYFNKSDRSHTNYINDSSSLLSKRWW